MNKESLQCEKQKPNHKTLKMHCTFNTEESELHVNMTINKTISLLFYFL